MDLVVYRSWDLSAQRIASNRAVDLHSIVESKKIDPVGINLLTNLESLSLSCGGTILGNPLEIVLDGVLFRLKYLTLVTETRSPSIRSEIFRRLPN